MPTIPDNSIHTVPRLSQPIRIAQATEGGAPPRAAAHTEKKEEEPSLGAIPDPVLLFENALIVAALLVVMAVVARRRLEATPRGAQNFFEFVVEAMNKFVCSIIGPEGEKYTPLVGTLFLYIFLMNLIGIIPGLHSPTGNISNTLALGMIVFIYVEYQGIKARGLVNHIKHFAGPLPIAMPILFPVEIVSESVRPFTLAIRLFGNIFGEDVIIVVLASMGALLGSTALGFLPLQFPVLILSLLTDGVQALVFCMLTCIYIALATHHEGGHNEAHEGAHDVPVPAHH